MSLLSESYKHLCGKIAEKLRKNCGKIAEKLRNQITNTHILSSFNFTFLLSFNFFSK